MNPPLKHQLLIDSQSFTIPCPDPSLFEDEKESFRWCCEPVTDEINFLPNLLEDEAKNKPRRLLKGDEYHCGVCALSFFDSLLNAKKQFNKYPLNTRSKLGYTHVATGPLSKSDGIMSSVNNKGHFLFYEYVGCDLS
ncbi:hypothetical protein [Spirosoma panaciterrae]|uniref:hypothetical protein n=1 Tax=Spirosoma panaciterrae TaxID=496058 RepID=UPI0012F7DAC2|nr:hypothetical protein [Spirosoma panaciterrae]